MNQPIDYESAEIQPEIQPDIQVLGISGSPVLDSNTDRAVKQILKHTGLRTEFVKLSELDFSPCRACLGCVNLNECVLNDDARALAMKFRHAPAFVLGGYTPYSSLDARTKAFMERMYCFRHVTAGNAGKIGVSVITTACPAGAENLPPAAETAATQIGFWMMAEGMKNLGSMTLLGNVPCIRCGRGDECPVSGIKMVHGAEATVEIDVVDVRFQRGDLLRRDRQSQFGFGLGQGDPKPAPGTEFSLRAEDFAHRRRSVTADQGIFVLVRLVRHEVSSLSPEGAIVNSPGREPWGWWSKRSCEPQRGDRGVESDVFCRPFGARTQLGLDFFSGLTPWAID